MHFWFGWKVGELIGRAFAGIIKVIVSIFASIFGSANNQNAVINNSNIVNNIPPQNHNFMNQPLEHGLLEQIYSQSVKPTGITLEINKKVAEFKERYELSNKELELRKRLDLDVEEEYINKSREKGLPFDCFDSWEFREASKAFNPEFSADTTRTQLSQIHQYMVFDYNKKENEMLKPFLERKAKIIIREICNRALQGDPYSQAVIGADNLKNAAMWKDKLEVLKMFDEEAKSVKAPMDIKGPCMASLLKKKELKEPNAMIAYAAFAIDRSTDTGNEEARRLLEEAGEMGCSAAYRELMTFNGNGLFSDESYVYALKGAECDDGPASFELQEWIADAYYYGDGFQCVPIDKEKGLEWYRRAAANGWESAIEHLESLKRRGEI